MKSWNLISSASLEKKKKKMSSFGKAASGTHLLDFVVKRCTHDDKKLCDDVPTFCGGFFCICAYVDVFTNNIGETI